MGWVWRVPSLLTRSTTLLMGSILPRPTPSSRTGSLQRSLRPSDTRRRSRVCATCALRILLLARELSSRTSHKEDDHKPPSRHSLPSTGILHRLSRIENDGLAGPRKLRRSPATTTWYRPRRHEKENLHARSSFFTRTSTSSPQTHAYTYCGAMTMCK